MVTEMSKKEPWAYHDTKTGNIAIREDVLAWIAVIAVICVIVIPVICILRITLK